MKPRVAPHHVNRVWGRRAVIGVPMVFLLLVFLLPFLVVFKISVSEMEGVAFRDVVTWAEGAIHFHIKFDNYLGLAQDALYFPGICRTDNIHLPVTGLSVCLLFGPQPGR